MIANTGFSAAAFIILSCTALVLNTPKGYIPLGETYSFHSQKKLEGLAIATIIMAMPAVAGLTYLISLSPLEEWVNWISTAINVVTLVIMMFTAFRLNRPQHTYCGGHYAIFLTILGIIASHCMTYQHYLVRLPELLKSGWGYEEYAHVVCGVSFILIFLVYGLWSDRMTQDELDQISKERGSSIFSQLFFVWMDPMIKEGGHKPLEKEHIWELIEADRADTVLEEYYRKTNRNQSLLWRLFLVNYHYTAYQLLCSLLDTILSFSGPYFLFLIVSNLQTVGYSRIQLLPYLFGLLGASVLKAVVFGQIYFTGRRAGSRVRIILIDELYQKSLQRVQGAGSSEGEEQASLGKIVTLMSVDTERIRTWVSYCHDVTIQVPFSIVISISSLYLVLGWSSLVGILIIALLGPLSTYLGRLVIRCQDQLLKFTDERVAIMNELLQGIRIVKYFAWENHFVAKVQKARNNELLALAKVWGAYIGFGAIGSGSGIIVTFATFAIYTFVAGKSLDAATAFTGVTLLKVVSDLLAYLPTEVMNLFKAKVSLDRISSYLVEQNIDRYNLDKESDENTSESDSITFQDTFCGFKNAEFKYYTLGDENESDFTLRNINIEFTLGKLNLVTGPTGSGKTSLLLALLGEMKRVSGSAYLPVDKEPFEDPVTGRKNTCAYAAQTAWLYNATIRDNILFGEKYDAKRYEEVIRVCALVKDFENFEGGDLTEIGEKGINLSGGQKQRVSLARVCYSRASYVILDDPLSAVDAPTARFLLHKCILKYLKGRTVILVSHATQLVVPWADYVVVMKNGSVFNSGTPREVSSKKDDELLYGIDLQKDYFDDEKEGYSEEGNPAVASHGNGTQLVQDEEQAVGAVKLSLYKMYFNASGGAWFFLSLILFLLLVSGAKFVDDWWLKQWTDHNSATSHAYSKSFLPQSNSYTQSNIANEFFTSSDILSSFIFKLSDTVSVNSVKLLNEVDDALYYIKVYALLGLVVIITANLQTVWVFYGSILASRNLHTKLLNRVLNAPLRFFEITPIGRILNRFSKDIESIDNDTMSVIQWFMLKIIDGIVIIVVIGYIIPAFLIFVPFIASAYAYMAYIYLRCSRELKRFESTSRSPIYSQFSETLAGVSTIRAYSAEKRFGQVNIKKINENHKPFFYVWASNRWLAMRTDLMSSFFVFIAGLATVFVEISAGWAALLMTYAMQMTYSLIWIIRMQAEMEMSMNSVERVEEYLNIEQEESRIVESNRPPESWPDRGVIEVENLHMRYSEELPDVLKGLNFRINSHEKVAVVGRTGAGKSTLSLAFFRIIPLSAGKIVIDGIDICEIGLQDLRTKLTIIPQDPVLFNGTLRSNLDPLEKHDDAEIWEALNRVNFVGSMQTKASKGSQADDIDELAMSPTPSSFSLDLPVSENGQNFSLGQRQLLCLARSLLEGNRVILLDEATASVDNETDSRIQKTIREEFSDRTILCIAHRLRTIIDYDKVLVLDKGTVLEFGTPLELLENSEIGVFKNMCEETGEYHELLEIARRVETKKQAGIRVKETI